MVDNLISRTYCKSTDLRFVTGQMSVSEAELYAVKIGYSVERINCKGRYNCQKKIVEIHEFSTVHIS